MLKLGPYLKTEEFHPHIALIIQDSQEGYALCSQRISSDTRRPCRFCWITRAKCNDPYATADLRTAEKNKKLAERARVGDMTVQDKESFLMEYSLSSELLNVANGTWGAPFGYPPEVGVNGAAVPDMLHQYLLGLLRTAVTLMKSTIKFTAGKLYKRKLKVLDRRFMALNNRHNDPHMPKHRYDTAFFVLLLKLILEFVMIVHVILVFEVIVGVILGVVVIFDLILEFVVLVLVILVFEVILGVIFGIVLILEFVVIVLGILVFEVIVGVIL